MASCGCRCIKCGKTELTSHRTGPDEPDGYHDMHHTCSSCGAHFDHLDGQTFDSCEKCGH